MKVTGQPVLSAMGTSDQADVLAFQARLPGGHEAVAFLNTNTSPAQTVSFRPVAPLRGQLRTWTYSAGNQNATNSAIVQGTASPSSPARGISLPPESWPTCSPSRFTAGAAEARFEPRHPLPV